MLKNYSKDANDVLLVLSTMNNIISFDFKYIDFDSEDVLSFHKCFDKKIKRF